MEPPETAWYRPRPGAEGRGLIDHTGLLHTWAAEHANHEREASDRGVKIAARLLIDQDGLVQVTGGYLDFADARTMAVAQDPRLR